MFFVFAHFEQLMTSSVVLGIASTLTPLGLGIALILGASTFARRMFPEGQVELPGWNTETVLRVGLALIGVAVLAKGAPSFVGGLIASPLGGPSDPRQV